MYLLKLVKAESAQDKKTFYLNPVYIINVEQHADYTCINYMGGNFYNVVEDAETVGTSLIQENDTVLNIYSDNRETDFVNLY